MSDAIECWTIPDCFDVCLTRIKRDVQGQRTLCGKETKRIPSFVTTTQGYKMCGRGGLMQKMMFGSDCGINSKIRALIEVRLWHCRQLDEKFPRGLEDSHLVMWFITTALPHIHYCVDVLLCKTVPQTVAGKCSSGSYDYCTATSVS